ncbi:protein translocase subunit SecD [Chitinimonas sp. BJB300]|uniref:protein translocase subunit SecD n=1 Tax=Chitinimonas sp. BJB300 TaxID=1559339 RepID=UPI000C10409D|nr:protein translocase subunit SecD [Chitinimonas sp. BJB300]PHV11604.1 protein translocase subunit SecD [Chitinimonas sp. BJB300]TSJ88092.1 protein translocase subunit SecD [Chitinimonas sp. BJB300]
MNRYPLWKYLIILAALALGLVYSVPNLYGESPAVQISGARSSIKVDNAVMGKVEQLLSTAKLPPTGLFLEGNSLKVRFKDVETQLKAKTLIQESMGENYVVALNLLPNTPPWLTALGAHPMFLGLDLRGGVHFLLEIDMKAAVDKAFERIAGDVRRELKDKKIRAGAIKRGTNGVEVQLRDAETLRAARSAIEKALPAVQIAEQSSGGNFSLKLTLTETELFRIKTDAVKQNIATLHNRVNELGTTEPVIQQQGVERIVVQLPGVQDTARAKDILGRTATLEVRMVEDDQSKLAEALNGNVPAGYELMDELDPRGNRRILVKRDVELTGENINDAQAGFDDHNQPAVHINLDGGGANIFRQLTAENVGKRMAMILVEKGKGQVVTAPVIRGEIGGGRVQISGSMTTADANDTALLLRAGSLAAPMEIVEERTIGPSLGRENIEKGFNSTLYGFAAIVVFMVIYYRVFGVTASIALAANVLFLIALLSMLQATLTLPGIAAIALTLGMAIDSNVLINERIREEVRNGSPPQTAIKAGYEHAWATILDSNITTLIAGVALLIFGSGAVRGFAVVHCLGILTSMFSAVVVSRGLVNLIYGYRRKVSKLAV